MFLIFNLDLIGMAFTIHISANILYTIIYVFSKMKEAFSPAPFYFLSSHQNYRKIPS